MVWVVVAKTMAISSFKLHISNVDKQFEIHILLFQNNVTLSFTVFVKAFILQK